MSPTFLTILAGLVFIIAAVGNWYAVTVGHRRLTVATKPVALMALIALVVVALGEGAATHGAGRWLLVGLVCCLAGDVFLLSDSDPAFLAGLASFLLGHLAYVAAFSTLGLHEPAWGLIGGMALIAALPWIARVVPAAHREGGAGLSGAVLAYILVIGAMVIAAWMTGEWLIGLGATTFMVSDTVLAATKFLGRRRHGDLAVMVTYHLGQVLIVLGVLAALAG